MNTRQATARDAKGAIEVLERMIMDRDRAIAALIAEARTYMKLHSACATDAECAERKAQIREALRLAEHLES